jgi:CDP-glucose 4,6-dehydratase
VIDTAFWRDCPVFLTGHTGFKGGWLALMLHMLGARVCGYALDPATAPNLFTQAKVAQALVHDVRANLNDAPALQAALHVAQPRVVFHLAAQPLVLASYADPVGTWADNVMGTARVLDAVRSVASVRAVVVITTDKVYENPEHNRPFAEADALGGHDPYSASKAACELAVSSWRRSFFSTPDAARIASARAGNVVGGGDWAADRLLPDCIRAFAAGQPVSLRMGQAVRPWQHVLEPLTGYVQLAQALLGPQGAAHATAYNFGPDPGGQATVGQVARSAAQVWRDAVADSTAQVVQADAQDQPHEAGLLRLDSTRARQALGWLPRWDLATTLHYTVGWYAQVRGGADAAQITRQHIAAYLEGLA